MGNDRIGYNGVDLDRSVLQKIKTFHERHPSVPIQIDIGVSEETIPELKKIGVSLFISNSAIFNSPNPQETLKKLQNI
jgi:ribulose-phosphate 3-epimerase